MKILCVVESMSLSQGGPPEVVRNNSKIIRMAKYCINWNPDISFPNLVSIFKTMKIN